MYHGCLIIYDSLLEDMTGNGNTATAMQLNFLN